MITTVTWIVITTVAFTEIKSDYSYMEDTVIKPGKQVIIMYRTYI